MHLNSLYESKGKARYKCADCGATAMFHPVELARKSTKCSACGCRTFDPDTEYAKEIIGQPKSDEKDKSTN